MVNILKATGLIEVMHSLSQSGVLVNVLHLQEVQVV